MSSSYRQNKEEAVKAALEAGKSVSEASKEAGVPARTIRYWRAQWQKQETVGPEVEREWPAEWTADFLIREAGFDPDRAAQYVLVAKVGSKWVRRFLRARAQIEIDQRQTPDAAQRLPADSRGHNWRDALAGLPVLADWLNCPEAQELADQIRERQPFTLGLPTTPAKTGLIERVKLAGKAARLTQRDQARLVSAQKGYASASRPFVNALRRRVAEIAYETNLGLPAEDRVPYAALTALLDRFPMVDSMPQKPLWPLFVQVFKFAPPEGGK